MKTFLKFAALTCGALFTMSSIAQDKKETAPKPAPSVATTTSAGPATPRVYDGYRPLPIGYYAKGLALTPDQMAKAKSIEADCQKEHGALGADMKQEDKMKAVKAMMEKRDAAFKEILTPEQLKTMSTMRQPTGAAPTMAREHVTPAVTPAPVPAEKQEKK